VNVGDLVTVLPYGESTYLITDYLEDSRDLSPDAPDALGPLWELYSEDLGLTTMHEKWIEVL